MTLQIPSISAVPALDSIVDQCEGGTGSATIELRTLPQPATCESVDVGVAAATMTLNFPAFAGAIDATDKATAAMGTTPTVEDLSAVGSGTAVDHFRIKTGTAAVVVFQGSVGAVGTEDIVLDTDIIAAGVTVTLTSLVFTLNE